MTKYHRWASRCRRERSDRKPESDFNQSLFVVVAITYILLLYTLSILERNNALSLHTKTRFPAHSTSLHAPKNSSPCRLHRRRQERGNVVLRRRVLRLRCSQKRRRRKELVVVIFCSSALSFWRRKSSTLLFFRNNKR